MSEGSWAYSLILYVLHVAYRDIESEHNIAKMLNTYK